MSNKHAEFSPSSAHRWLNCPASYQAEKQFPRGESSSYADEGTAAHSLASLTLDKMRGFTAFDVAKRITKCPETGIEFTIEMATHVQTYVNTVLDYAEDNTLFVEQRVDYSELVGYPDSFGTADAIILTADGREIQTHDLKYGMGVTVDAEENEQLLLYACGVYLLMETITDIKKVQSIRLVIHQPRQGRISEWSCSVAYLLNFADKAAEAITKAVLPNAPFNPGEKQCTFCRAKGSCKALANYVMRSIGDDFEDLDALESKEQLGAMIEGAIEKVPYLSHDQLGDLVTQFDLLHDFMKAARGEVEARLLGGELVRGWKLVEGKLGNRKWIDVIDAETMLKSMRIPTDDMYDKTVISPTTAEKLLSKDSPRKWKKLETIITRTPGQPSVAPESDKRPALIITTADEDFEDLEDYSDVA